MCLMWTFSLFFFNDFLLYSIFACKSVYITHLFQKIVQHVSEAIVPGSNLHVLYNSISLSDACTKVRYLLFTQFLSVICFLDGLVIVSSIKIDMLICPLLGQEIRWWPFLQCSNSSRPNYWSSWWWIWLGVHCWGMNWLHWLNFEPIFYFCMYVCGTCSMHNNF